MTVKVTPAGMIKNKDGTFSWVIFGEDGEALYCKDYDEFKKCLEEDNR